MTLSPEQKQAVSTWVTEGSSLSVIQKKLREHFQVSMTYMEVRFLVDDLGLELKSPTPAPAPKVEVPEPKAAAPAEKKAGLFDKLKKAVGAGGDEDSTELADEDIPVDEALEAEPVPAGGGVSVDVDLVVRPGMVVSGSVTFSDGTSGKWALDQMGRLMLDTGKKGYQPSPADVQQFQTELSAQLQKRGY